MAQRLILLDTSILIDYLRKKNKEKTHLFTLVQLYKPAISTITEYEFLVGFPRVSNWVDQFLDYMEILSFNSLCVSEAVKIYKELKKKNKLISIPDIFIASTAIANKIPVATLNQKHFSRIKSLKIIKLSSLK